MIALAPLPRERGPELHHLALGEGQEAFVLNIAEMTSETRDTVDFHAVWEGDAPVGFFKIDRAYHEDAGFAKRGDWGLRGMLIGAQYQNRGLGRATLAALPDYMRRTYPGCFRLWLTVNRANTVAYRAYRKAGWRDTGRVWEGGRSGPQHILSLDF